MLSDSGRTIKEVIDILETKVAELESLTQEIKESLTIIHAKLDTLLDIEQGNWKIENYQMIFFDRQGNELMRFDLKDKQGRPTELEVFERVRVNNTDTENNE
jgi:hypothetical protein